MIRRLTLVAGLVLGLASTVSGQSGCLAPDDPSGRIVAFVTFILTDTSQASTTRQTSDSARNDLEFQIRQVDAADLLGSILQDPQVGHGFLTLSRQTGVAWA